MPSIPELGECCRLPFVLMRLRFWGSTGPPKQGLAYASSTVGPEIQHVTALHCRISGPPFQRCLAPESCLKPGQIKDITFIDTPGVLSGSKQTIGRDYDFAPGSPGAFGI